MNKFPLVSVIIPAYNAEDFIEETIQSVLSQVYKNIEIIVVDDGSTDRTAELVQAFGERVKYLWQPNSGGCSSPRNHGARMASGEYLTFFDADDLMVESKIENLVRAIQANGMLGLSISNYVNFNGDKLDADHFSTCCNLTKLFLRHGSRFILSSTESTELLLTENFSIASAPLFRRDAFCLAGGFDETLKSCEDFHLIYRIAMQHPITVVDRVGFRRRVHGNNMSANNEKMLLNYIKSRSSLLEMESRTSQAKLLRGRIQRYQLELSNLYITKGLPNKANESLRDSFSIGQLSHKVLAWQLKTAVKIAMLYVYSLAHLCKAKSWLL